MARIHSKIMALNRLLQRLPGALGDKQKGGHGKVVRKRPLKPRMVKSRRLVSEGESSEQARQRKRDSAEAISEDDFDSDEEDAEEEEEEEEEDDDKAEEEEEEEEEDDDKAED